MQQSIMYVALEPWIDGKANNVYSQFGEDGLIEAALDRVGTTNQWCFEFGAADGRFFSNTRRLVEQGWQAVWIEVDLAEYNKILSQNMLPGVSPICAMVTPANVDQLLLGAGCPDEPDFGVIDVDGEDGEIWAAMKCRPRVILVEFQPGEKRNGEQAIIAIGESLGYRAVARTYCNILSIRNDC